MRNQEADYSMLCSHVSGRGPRPSSPASGKRRRTARAFSRCSKELLSAFAGSEAEAGGIKATELPPGLDRCRAPAPSNAFSNERNKLQALTTAKSFRVLEAALAVLIAGSDLPRMKG